MGSIKHLLSAAVLATCCIGTSSHAASDVSTLDGNYALDLKASDDISAIVETAVADVTFAWRTFARQNILAMHPAYPSIKIAHDKNAVVVTFDGRNPMSTPFDGTATPWKREDGDMLSIASQWNGTSLLQTIKKGGTWQHDNDFSLNADGRLLTLKVHFVSKLLDKPLQYRLIYRREAIAANIH